MVMSQTPDFFLGRKNGQQTITGLILLFVFFIILVSLTPIINNQSAIAAGNLTDGTAAVIVRMIPLFFWLMFIITLFVYTQVFRG